MRVVKLWNWKTIFIQKLQILNNPMNRKLSLMYSAVSTVYRHIDKIDKMSSSDSIVLQISLDIS